MTKAEGYTNFTFRLDDALRAEAERLAKADKRSLGVWIALAIEDAVKRAATRATPRAEPARKR